MTPAAGPSQYAQLATPALYSMDPPMLPDSAPEVSGSLPNGSTFLSDADIQPFLSQLSGFFSLPTKPTEPDLPVNWNELDFSWLLNEDPSSSTSPFKATGNGTDLPSYTGMDGESSPPQTSVPTTESSAEEHL